MPSLEFAIFMYDLMHTAKKPFTFPCVLCTNGKLFGWSENCLMRHREKMVSQGPIVHISLLDTYIYVNCIKKCSWFFLPLGIQGWNGWDWPKQDFGRDLDGRDMMVGGLCQSHVSCLSLAPFNQFVLHMSFWRKTVNDYRQDFHVVISQQNR